MGIQWKKQWRLLRFPQWSPHKLTFIYISHVGQTGLFAAHRIHVLPSSLSFYSGNFCPLCLPRTRSFLQAQFKCALVHKGFFFSFKFLFSEMASSLYNCILLIVCTIHIVLAISPSHIICVYISFIVPSDSQLPEANDHGPHFLNSPSIHHAEYSE